MPQLNAFYQSSDEKTTVLGFNNMLLPGETLKQAMTKVKIDFPVIEESLSAYYHLPRIDVEPTVFVINPRGKLVKVVQGMTTVAKLEVIMKNLKHAFQLPQKQIMPTQSPLEGAAHLKQDTLKNGRS